MLSNFTKELLSFTVANDVSKEWLKALAEWIHAESKRT